LHHNGYGSGVGGNRSDVERVVHEYCVGDIFGEAARVGLRVSRATVDVEACSELDRLVNGEQVSTLPRKVSIEGAVYRAFAEGGAHVVLVPWVWAIFDLFVGDRSVVAFENVAKLGEATAIGDEVVYTGHLPPAILIVPQTADEVFPELIVAGLNGFLRVK
jgi:hypothetical protein